MQMHGKVLSGMTQTITTKKGTPLPKARLKVLDTGPETQGDVQFYWMDFLGEVALSESELEQVRHQEVVVEIRRIVPTQGRDGKAYLNITAGAVLLNGAPVQAALKVGAGRRSA